MSSTLHKITTRLRKQGQVTSLHAPQHLSKGLLPQMSKENHYILSSQLRANQMSGPPWEGQLMRTVFLSTRP